MSSCVCERTNQFVRLSQIFVPTCPDWVFANVSQCKLSLKSKILVHFIFFLLFSSGVLIFFLFYVPTHLAGFSQQFRHASSHSQLKYCGHCFFFFRALFGRPCSFGKRRCGFHRHSRRSTSTEACPSFSTFCSRPPRRRSEVKHRSQPLLQDPCNL